MSALAAYVVEGVCPCCGAGGARGGRVHWTPERIVAAAIANTNRLGRPPRAHEWNAGTPEHPAQATVARVFGSWNRMLTAAGLEVRPKNYHPPTLWTKDMVADAILDWLLTTGSWPSENLWKRGRKPGETLRPSAHTVRRVFGSWNAAKLYAGWHPDAPAPWRCAGCDRQDADDFTLGCRHCDDRRLKRQRTKSGPALDGNASSPSPSSLTGVGMRSVSTRAGTGRGGATPPNKPTRRRERSFATAASDRKEV